MFTEDDLLPLSGLQHMAFCERQWALIHIEQQWEENPLTAEGHLLHERVHASGTESRKTLVTVCALSIHSLRLGLVGQADAVEFCALPAGDTGGVALEGRSGRWRPCPVEYKRGKPKRQICDLVQVCAQALCLEEMLQVEVPEGALFYATPRRRRAVPLTPQLRARTESLCLRMHELYRKQLTPPPVYSRACESCSLNQTCCPRALTGPQDVRAYLAAALVDGTS